MKKSNVIVAFDEEKLSALKMYLSQKNTTAEKELTKSLDTLYCKTVPVGVREFIALRSSSDLPTEKKKKNVAPSAVSDTVSDKGEVS